MLGFQLGMNGDRADGSKNDLIRPCVSSVSVKTCTGATREAMVSQRIHFCSTDALMGPDKGSANPETNGHPELVPSQPEAQTSEWKSLNPGP